MSPPTLLTLAMLLGQSYASVSAEEAPPSWGLEFRAGPYMPRASSDKTAREYFKLLHTSGGDRSLFKNRPLMKNLVINYYLDATYGLAGVQLTAGHWRTKGAARTCSTDTVHALCNADTVFESTRGSTPIAFTVLPIGVGGIFRMDLLKNQYAIPLVPYAVLGLDYYFWWATTNGKTARATDANGKTQRAAGGTMGLHGSLGLSLNLDWLEPETARRGRRTTGIADSYLYAEVSQLLGDGFGGKRFDMSATLVTAGLAIDFL